MASLARFVLRALGLTVLMCPDEVAGSLLVLCDSGNYTCDDWSCVADASFCDGKRDCADGSDEDYCQGGDPYIDYNYDTMFQKRPDADRQGEKDVCAAVDSLPSACRCQERSHLYCDRASLTTLPPDIPSLTTVLDLSGNRLANISFGDFQTLHRLHKLIIANAELRLIFPGTFRMCLNLTEVYLAGNEIGDLADDVFPENNTLEVLDLRSNRLRILKPDYFRTLRHLKSLYLMNNGIEAILPTTFQELTRLQFLTLDGNKLQTIRAGHFAGLSGLKTLRLSKNLINHTELHCFLTNQNLTTLDLSNNPIRNLPAAMFLGLQNLHYLDLQQNEIVSIEADAFAPLTNLLSLNVAGNSLQTADAATFAVMPRLQHIYFQVFYQCAYVPQVEDCRPTGDGISSRHHLLDSVVLRGAAWLVALLALGGNVAVFMGRTIVRDGNHVHSFLIKNLSLADLLMGIYLVVLATHDLRFRGTYLSRDKEWRDSWSCDVIGILATVSSEASVLTLTIITLDRYACIVHPLKLRHRTLSHAYLLLTVVWSSCLLLALLPVVGLDYFGHGYYRQNAVCVPLFVHKPWERGWQYSTFLFIGLNIAAFVFITYAYGVMFLTIRKSRLTYRPANDSQERTLMKRFFFIVVTDLLCWLPVIVLKVAAFAGVRVSGEVYAWLAVFVLPVNAALNPLLYTLTTKLFKQRLLDGLGLGQPPALSPRRRSLETTSSSTTSSTTSFSSLKGRASSPLAEKDCVELELFSGSKTKGGKPYMGRIKYMYSHGRVIYPPGRPGPLHVGYKPVLSVT